jgi:hypothetical protein
MPRRKTQKSKWPAGFTNRPLRDSRAAGLKEACDAHHDDRCGLDDGLEGV